MSHLSFQSRRAFLKTLATATAAAPFVTSNLFARSASGTLRHASFGCGGMAQVDLKTIAACKGVEIVALCDVDQHQAIEACKLFPQARFYRDWRQLLDCEAKNLDSVNVSTPDHMHAPIAMTALRLGKHVYGQKPLAHNIAEVRAMTELARKKSVVTQMGIQIHSAAPYRKAVRILQDGVIGKVKEIHTWCPKSWGDMSDRPERSDPVPYGLDWDLWLGACADRPFIGEHYYHPGNWRKRLDFGTGTLGDMGCHLFDPIFSGLELAHPISVRSEGPKPNAWNWALNGKVEYRFPGNTRTASEVLPVTWYDGSAKPPAELAALTEGDGLPETGSLFIGTEGVMALPHYSRPMLYPDAKFKDYKYPEVGQANHWEEFVQACQGQGKTSADFNYSGPLSEAILLGCIASHFPHTTMEWDARRMRTNLPEADRHLRRACRKGWSVRGL
jgi:predicted dehydrogenase